MKEIAFAFLLGLVLLPSVALTEPQEAIRSLNEKLNRWDAEEAWLEVQSLLRGAGSQDPQLLELASKIAFFRGDYGEARRLIRSALERGGEEEKRRALSLFYEQTLEVVSPFKRYETPHFLISIDEKQDGILVPYLQDMLEKTYRSMAQRYGFEPKEKVRVEILPDARAFYLVSSLSARDIEVAGAVGVAQFNKLMILSPRALVYGYRWLDALSHEYLHYLITKVTANKAPIWFHEGLAKYEETRWRSGPSYLSPLSQTLLAQALATGKLIGFERMEPSLVKLETPEEVQLAYAQAASAIEFILSRVGDEGLKKVMRRMAASSGQGAGEAIEEVMGWTFSEFADRWKESLSSRGLKEVEGVQVRRYKIREGKADEERLDRGEIRSLIARNRAHLGDRLREKGRREAAVLEYRRALAESRVSVPVMNRLADVLLQLGRDPEAINLLQEAGKISPDHPTIYTHLGRAYLKVKDFQSAREALENSIQINPFNPEVHQNLAIALDMLGQPAAALQEREIARKLAR